MKKKKILFDISHLIHGYTGIQQDLRYTLEALVESEKYEIDLLLYDMVNNYDFITFDYKRNEKIFESHVAQAKLLSHFFSTGRLTNLQGRSPLKWFLRKSYERLLWKKNDFFCISLLKDYNEAILRKLIAGDISSKAFTKLLNSKILISNISSEALIRRMNMKKYELPYIDTHEYDIAIFIQEFPVLISPNTKKVVRTYDLLQILSPDVVYMADYKSAYQYRSIKECIAQNAHFTTISNNVKKDLNKLFEHEKIKSETIECTISDYYKVKRTEANNLLAQYGVKNNVKKYILAVSTIEPRKNFSSAYTAFKLLKEKKEYKDLKFVVIGSKSWLTNPADKLIFDDRDVILVKNVLIQDMPKFYSHAELLLFVPFLEGFGLPPVEAQASGCLVVNSNIEVHREIQGKSSFYANPYNVEDIAHVMDTALRLSRKEKNNRIKIGKLNANKYKKESIIKKWISFIERL